MVENIVRKGEIACYKQFLLFSLCFPQLYIFSVSKFGNGLTNLRKKTLEKIVEKGENAGNLHFLLFPQFSFLSKTDFAIRATCNLSSATPFNLVKCKILSGSKQS